MERPSAARAVPPAARGLSLPTMIQ